MNITKYRLTIGATVLVLILSLIGFGQKTTDPALVEKCNQAEMHYWQTDVLLKVGTAESMRRALEKFDTAQRIYRETLNKTDEAVCLNQMGFISNRLGEKQKALKYYNQALPIYRQVGEICIRRIQKC